MVKVCKLLKFQDSKSERKNNNNS